MTAALPVESLRRSLPPLSGRLLWLYRLSWATLALAALAVIAFSVADSAMQPAILALRLAKAVVVVGVAGILFRRRQSDPVAAMLALAFLCWTITSSFDFTEADPFPVLLDRVRFLLFALALLLFPDGGWRRPWTRSIAVVTSVVFLLGIVEGLQLTPFGLFLPLAIACVLAAVAALIRRYQIAQSDALRQQLKWVALGLVSGIGLILCARAGAAFSGGLAGLAIEPVLLEALFQLGIVLVALGFLVSLLRYRLYDAETVISRSATYAVLTIGLLAIFAASEGLIEILGQRYLGSGVGDFSAAFAGAIAAVLLAPMHERISAWAERRFQRDLLDLKEQLPELLTEIAGSASVRRIGLAALPRIAAAIHATRAALIIDNHVIAAHGLPEPTVAGWAREWKPLLSTRPFDCDRDTLFPLRMVLRCPFGSLRGWLLLGPRPDGSPYRHDELDALRIIAKPLRQTLFAARERELKEACERRKIQAASSAVERLSRRLDRLEITGALRRRSSSGVARTRRTGGD